MIRARRKAKRKPVVDQPSLWPQRAALTATVFSITVSIAVAVPSQLQYFFDARDVTSWTDPYAWYAVAQTLLLESLCWLCALLYAASLANTPVRLYRLGTFLFAGVAAAINFKHGASGGDATIGVLNALGSLMGVGAWELYMHRARHRVSGLSLAEIRLRALRWRKHPLVMREAGRIVATFGLAVPHEVAFRMAYLRRIGNPTLPVAVTSPRLADRPDDRRPELPRRKPSAARKGTEPAVELPVDWSCPDTFEALLGEAWPTPGPELGGVGSAGPEGRTDRTEFRRKAPPVSGDAGSAAAGKGVPAPPVTSGRNSAARNPELRASSAAKAASAAVRNSDKVRFDATSAERGGSGFAKSRILKYLARAEQLGHSTAELDQEHIAAQFGVGDRMVRKVINDHSKRKQQS